MANLTNEEAYQYSELHICYELDMLRWSTSALLNIKKDTDSTDPNLIFIKNAIIETFAIHSRNLIDFLFPPIKTHKSDVTIRDYLDDIGNQQIPECRGILDEARTKAHKQVAHLTTERISYETTGKEWKYLDIYNGIIDQFIYFKSHFVVSRMSLLVNERMVKIMLLLI